MIHCNVHCEIIISMKESYSFTIIHVWIQQNILSKKGSNVVTEDIRLLKCIIIIIFYRGMLLYAQLKLKCV